MRILITFGRQPPYPQIGADFTEAFRSLGHMARLLCVRDRPWWGTWAKRLPHPWKARWRWEPVSYANDLLLNTAKEYRADALIEIGGDLFTPQTLRTLKRRWGIWLSAWLVEGQVGRTPDPVLRDYDLVVSTSQVAMEQLRHAGFPAVGYLPFATNPRRFYPAQGGRGKARMSANGLGFIGAYSPKREQVLAQVADLGLHIWGSDWDVKAFSPAFRRTLHAPRGVFGKQLVRCYQSTALFLNVQREHMTTEIANGERFGTGLNWRHFDVPACGNLVLSEPVVELPEAFEVGQEVEVFASPQELRDKARYLLTHEAARSAMAQRAYARIIHEHTHVHRVQRWIQWYERACRQMVGMAERYPGAMAVSTGCR